MRVLVTVERTQETPIALRWALSRAAALEIGALFVHHVARRDEVPADAVGGLEGVVAKLKALYDACSADLELGDLESRFVVSLGDPATEILEAIGNHGIGCVVMSSSDKKGLDRFFQGSVAEKVVREAPCTVIVVRPPPINDPS